MSAPVFFERFVALGDSTTEGLDDARPEPGPHGEVVYRGWADRLAERLALDNPALLYANLAVRGRLIAPIRETQLAPALAMRPDLVSVVGGVNDVLRPGFELTEVAGHLRAMVDAFRAQEATVLVMTLPDLGSSMRIARIVSQRLMAYNDAVRTIAAETGATLVDLAQELSVYDPRGWSPDRLHANDIGHQYLMWGAAKALGVEEAATRLQELKDDAAPVQELPPLRELMQEVAWAWEHLRPWIMRRLRGRSSGDGVSPKRPELAPVEV